MSSFKLYFGLYESQRGINIFPFLNEVDSDLIKANSKEYFSFGLILKCMQVFEITPTGFNTTKSLQNF